MEYYKKGAERVLKELNTGIKGLSSKEAGRRLVRYGYNEIKGDKGISKLRIFINQFNSFVIWLLIAATLLSFFIGEVVDGSVILTIIILNGIFGFIQEYKAERSIEALKKMAALKSIVIRDGRRIVIDAKEVVPGDLIILEEGSKVPADARVIESIGMAAKEASLTGESVPVTKSITALKGNLSLGDQTNMVFSSTIISRGRGKAVVVSTGEDTEIGKIAHLVQKTKREVTPLQRDLDRMGKKLGVLTIIIGIIIFGLEVMSNTGVMSLLENVRGSFLVAIALVVAAIPEGLPAVVTISLALGVRRMVKRNALVRRMVSVETLGSTDIICTDKTGTLTRNEMTVKKIYFSGDTIEVMGDGYLPKGSFISGGKYYDPRKLKILLKTGALCNNAQLLKEGDDWNIMGDPTEGALLVSAKKGRIGLDNEKRVIENPFSSERKMMSVVYKEGRYNIVYVKGAPEVILGRCNKAYHDGTVKRLTPKLRKEIIKANEEFAKGALRVLGFAYKKISTDNKRKIAPNIIEKGLIFAGLQGMIDPPRKEAKKSVATAHEAGIRVIMITGDHKDTAAAVADEIGIKGRVITGEELSELSDKEFESMIDDVNIYARVNPEDKIKIVGMLKKKGHIVSMTGDGVNDAPALKKADMGVGMGITGTDVAKEASDMVLTDDNFASIVNAIEEGRGIYDNIKKFINYLLSSNLGEILVIFIASIIGMPLPLTAVQLLWLNLVTDGLPAIALGADPVAKGVMKRMPRDPKKSILGKNMLISILVMGSLIAAGTLSLFHMNLANLVKAQTIAFTSLVVFEIVRLQMIRSSYKVGIFSNRSLILAVISSLGLQLIVLYTPLSVFFKTVPLSILDWAYISAAVIILILVNSVIRGLLRFKGIVEV